MNYYGHTGSLPEILDRLHKFLTQYNIYAKEYIPRITFLIANACMDVHYRSAAYEFILQIFEDAQKTCRDEEENTQIQTAKQLFHFQRVLADSRIGETLLSYLELLHDFHFDEDESDEDEDEMLQKFSITDLQLCMIQEREDILAQAEILRQDHPEEYKKIAEFIKKLENKSKILLLKDQLLKTYKRLQPYFYDGQFYEQYPEEKILAMGSVIHKGLESKPYTRSTKKIGRNDPCPCGSGKKYKHCCMNKNS